MYDQYSDSSTEDDRSRRSFPSSAGRNASASSEGRKKPENPPVPSAAEEMPQKEQPTKGTARTTAKETVTKSTTSSKILPDESGQTSTSKMPSPSQPAVMDSNRKTEKQQKQKMPNSPKPSGSAPILESGQKERAAQKTIASKPKPHAGITKSLDVFGSTSPQENFDHFSFTCHLFPHLSESNLQFHDLYWNKQPATGAITLRKRRVLVNKVLKGFCVRANPDQAELGAATFRANISFLDRRPFAKREIVSNVYSVQVPVAESGMTRVFKKTPASASLLIRSNYRQREVALQIIVEQHSGTTGIIKNIGRMELELLDERGRMALENRAQSKQFEGGVKFEFEMADVSQREQIYTDSLPDVLICDERWVPMLAIYRQLMCERLAEDGDVFADRPTWVVDPIIGTFGPLIDTDRDAIELLLLLMQKYDVINKKEFDPSEAVRGFHFIYMQFIVPMLAMADSRNWRKQLRAFASGQTSEEPNPILALGTEHCRMLDINEYAINLIGNHAID